MKQKVRLYHPGQCMNMNYLKLYKSDSVIFDYKPSWCGTVCLRQSVNIVLSYVTLCATGNTI